MNKRMIPAISSALCNVEKKVLAGFFVLMLVMLMIQVVCRYYLHLPLAWVEEVIRYIYISVGFLGAAVAVKEKAHIEINILPSILGATKISKEKTNKILVVCDVIVAIIGAGLWGYVTYTMTNYMFVAKTNVQTSVALGIPMWALIAIIVVSGVLCIIHYVFNMIETIQTGTSLQSKEEEELKAYE